MKLCKNYINGEWVEAKSGKKNPTTNPATGEVLAEVTQSGPEDVDAAVAAAKHSFYVDRTWRDMDSQTRGDFLWKISDIMDKYRDELAKIESMDMGKPLREAEGDVDDAIHCYRYYAGLIKAPYGGIYDVNEGFGKMFSYTTHEPIGVCALISAWNFPLVMGSWKLAPSLAAGNSIIFKPASQCVLSNVKMFEIFDEAEMPAGSCNLILGPGGSIGDVLSSHPDIEMICLTGSTVIGQQIMRNAATNVKKIGLELGGKSPNIILADVDLEAAVEWSMIAIFFNQGAVCCAGSRIIIDEKIHDAFVKRFVERANAMTLGNPLDNPDMGPIVSEGQFNEIMRYIELGKKEGATLLCGGERYTEGECAKGFYIRPTIFDNCTPDMTIVREEIFGPVVTIQTFKTIDEAIEKANDTIYGLAGGVMGYDYPTVMKLVQEIRAGIIWVNAFNPTFNEAPWGGYKMSGLGRELGEHGLEEYQEIKQVNWNMDIGAPGWYEH